MPRMKRFSITALVALGSLVVLGQPARAGISVSVQPMYPVPSSFTGEKMAVMLWATVVIDPGWYFIGMDFTGTADESGQALAWRAYPKSSLISAIYGVSLSPVSGQTVSGGYGEALIDLNTPLGVYDRDPHNLGESALFTVYGMTLEGEFASSSTRVSFNLRDAVVPEPASALLLASGLLVPAGVVWLRRRRTA